VASTPSGKPRPICGWRWEDFQRIRGTSKSLIPIQLIRRKFACERAASRCALASGCTKQRFMALLTNGRLRIACLPKLPDVRLWGDSCRSIVSNKMPHDLNKQKSAPRLSARGLRFPQRQDTVVTKPVYQRMPLILLCI
jgi:hypothetical protein